MPPCCLGLLGSGAYALSISSGDASMWARFAGIGGNKKMRGVIYTRVTRKTIEIVAS